ncbi:hypothetical protein T484DRAFT_1758472 [Baffinella frigidus]|nr:hypothetical protein T484DRAFT_1758472 [Cryptophyta sp. CCMP2293]
MNADDDDDYSDREIAANEEWDRLMGEIDHNDDDLDDGYMSDGHMSDEQIRDKIIEFFNRDLAHNLRAFYHEWTPMWYALSYQRRTNPEQWPTSVIAYLVANGITRPTVQEELEFFRPQDGAPPLSPPDSPRYRSPSPDPSGLDTGMETPPPRSPNPVGEPHTEIVTLITNSIMQDLSIR